MTAEGGIQVGGETLYRKQLRDRIQTYPGGLYLFTKWVMQRHKLKPHLHLPFCNFIQLHGWEDHAAGGFGPRLASRKTAFMPREHFKSTVCSEALPLWLLAAVDRNMTVALVSANDKNTKKWLRKIKETIEYNDIFAWLYPEIRKGPKWDEEEIVITRDRGSEVQASITAYSVRSGLASQHHDYIICDDLVNEQTAESVVEMDRSVRLYQSLEEILKGWHDSRGFLVVGTPWGREDVLHETLREESLGTRYKWGIGVLGEFTVSEGLSAYPEMIPIVTPGKPILPTECDQEKLDHIKNQSHEKYFLNYLCKPYDEGRNGFDLSLFRDFSQTMSGRLECQCHPNHYHDLYQGTTLVVSDPAYTKEKTDNRCETSILVGNKQPCGCRFLMDDWGGKIEPTEYIERASILAKKHQPWLKYWGVEADALQVTLLQWLQESQKVGEFPLGVRIFPLKTKNRAKDARIQRAQPSVSQGFWHKPPNMHMVSNVNSLLSQLYQWPYSRKRDRADAFGYFEDAWAEFPAGDDYVARGGPLKPQIQSNKRRGDADIARISMEMSL